VTGPGSDPLAETFHGKFIGYVHSDTVDEDVPHRRRDMIVDIEILDRYAEALAGIEDYSHLFVLFWMHKVDVADWRPRRHPHNNSELPQVGVFAARGRDRPNPIGLAVVELIARKDNRLTVRRLDAFDGTPIIDIKPYDYYDRVDELRVPAWWERKKHSK
jgi:tRNA-Thr(GGU) m(6)t(6)A37 methyltransferase TsaA